MSESLPLVSVVMPIRNEATYIRHSLGSIFRQDFPAEQMEIIISDGMSQDATRPSIANMGMEYPRHTVRVIPNPNLIMPSAFNLGVKAARGKYIVMTGGHNVLEPGYISTGVAYLEEHPEVACVGGHVRSVGENWMSELIARALASPFSVGGAAYRIETERVMEVDTANYGIYRADIFTQIGLLDEEMVRNQDDEFNYRLRKNGGKIVLNPAMKAVYSSRSSFQRLWKQYYQYGYYKVRVLQKHPRQMSLRQFIPFIFVLALLLSLILAIFTPIGLALFGLALGAYLLANLFATVNICRKDGWAHWHVLPLVFAIFHVSYGVGFGVGLIRFANRWQDR